jgi:hypothetical protein
MGYFMFIWHYSPNYALGLNLKVDLNIDSHKLGSINNNMPLTIIPLSVINSYRTQYVDPPPEFAAFMKGLQTSTYARKPLTHQISQNRGSVQPPQVKTVILELFNRMTTDNVPRIIDTITKLKISTATDLTTLLDYIFKFATSKQDARMSRAYAELVKGLVDLQVGDQKLVVKLLNRCQLEFKSETECELVERKDLAIAGDDGDADGISRAFKLGLVQFIAALSVAGVLREELFDRSLASILSACCANIPDQLVNIRVEAAVKMSIIVADRYKRQKTSNPLIVRNLELLTDIMEKRIVNVSTKARMAVCDFMDLME